MCVVRVMCGRTLTELAGACSEELATTLEAAAETTKTGLVRARYDGRVWQKVPVEGRQIGDRLLYRGATHKELRLPSREAVDQELARLEARGFRVSQRSESSVHVVVLAHRGWDGSSYSISWESGS